MIPANTWAYFIEDGEIKRGVVIVAHIDSKTKKPRYYLGIENSRLCGWFSECYESNDEASLVLGKSYALAQQTPYINWSSVLDLALSYFL